MLYSPLLSILRILPVIFWVMFCLPLHMLCSLIFKNDFLFYNILFKGLVNLFGIKLKVSGKIEKKNVLFVSNHISYLDIFILGSLTKAIFVAKSEIKSWPIINKIAAIGKTIFIERSKVMRIKDQVEILSNTLKKGKNLILFPEGTSSDGSKVLPFKSSLFGLSDLYSKKKFKIQPISITYSKLDGVPVERKFRPFFAWFGNMDLITHAWQFLGLGLCEVNVRYHKSVPLNFFNSRKEASQYCFNVISEQVGVNFKNIECHEKIKLYEFKLL